MNLIELKNSDAFYKTLQCLRPNIAIVNTFYHHWPKNNFIGFMTIQLRNHNWILSAKFSERRWTSPTNNNLSIKIISPTVFYINIPNEYPWKVSLHCECSLENCLNHSEIRSEHLDPIAKNDPDWNEYGDQIFTVCLTTFHKEFESFLHGYITFWDT